MPNWCYNRLTIRHKDPAAVAKFCDAYNSGETMQTIMPCPQELRDTMAGFCGAGTPEQKALDEKSLANVEKYGYANWYDWCCAKWGTKWDFGRRENEPLLSPADGAAEITFDTAWSPPSGFYDHLHEAGYAVEAYFFEPGCAFCGQYADGVEDSYQVDSSLDGIPESLVEELGLRDFYSEEQEA